MLAILSWISIGFAAVFGLLELLQGPLTEEELDVEKALVMESMTPEMMDLIGEEYAIESIHILEVSTQSFWAINLLNFAITALGFYAVLMMYRLKKFGYYLYLLYSVAPIVLWFGFYGPGMIANFVLIFGGIFSLLFCILYGVQLKRMS